MSWLSVSARWLLAGLALGIILVILAGLAAWFVYAYRWWNRS